MISTPNVSGEPGQAPFGEGRALRVRHVDFLRARVEVAENLPDGSKEGEVVSPKSHLRRTVPVPRFLVEDLARYVAGKSPSDRIFTNGAGSVVTNQNFRRDVFDRAVRVSGVAPFTPHNLRDVAASLAVSAGANVKAVQRMLGHASAAMTLDLYASLFSDDLDDVAIRLNDAALEAQRLRENQGVPGVVVAQLRSDEGDSRRVEASVAAARVGGDG